MNRKQLIIVGYYDVNSNVVLAAARREDLRFLKWFKEDASFKIDETVNYSTISTIFACCKVPDKGSYLPPDIVLQLYRNAYCRSLSLGKIVSDLRFWLSPSDFPTAQPPQKRDFVHARVCFDESLPFVQTVTCLEKSIDVFFDLISVNSFTVSQHPQLQTKLKHLMFLLQMKTKTPEEEQKFPLLIIDDRQPPPAKEELKTGNQPLVKAAAANCNVCEEPLYAGKFVRCSLQTCTCRMCYGCVVTWLSGKLPVQQSTACVKCKLGQLDIGAVVGLLPTRWTHCLLDFYQRRVFFVARKTSLKKPNRENMTTRNVPCARRTSACDATCNTIRDFLA
jgi:hypothetical protein